MSYRRLVGFGEAMLRLTAPDGAGLATAESFRASVGGAELNGLIAAARSAMPGTWVSAVPDNDLGELVRRHARVNDVEVVMAPSADGPDARLGVYFLEPTVAPRPPAIVYDRRGSAFAQLEPGGVDWDGLLTEDTCLYVTGITPPLGTGPRKEMDAAISAARSVGAPVALDVNYRSALWSREACVQWLRATLDDVDILSASAGDLRAAGIDAADPVMAAMEQFSLTSMLSVTKQRTNDVVEIQLRIVSDGTEATAEARATVVDQIGAGDALFGTLLALLPGGDLSATAARAVGAAVTCYGLFGDALTADPWDQTETRAVIR